MNHQTLYFVFYLFYFSTSRNVTVLHNSPITHLYDIYIIIYIDKMFGSSHVYYDLGWGYMNFLVVCTCTCSIYLGCAFNGFVRLVVNHTLTAAYIRV